MYDFKHEGYHNVVGAPNRLSKTPVMHTFMTPRSSCREPHNRTGNQSTTSIQPNLKWSYNNGIMAKSYIKCLEGEVQHITQRIIAASSLGPSHALNPTCSWLGERPSSQSRHRTLHLPHSHRSLAKLIVRDKHVSTLWNCTCKPPNKRICKRYASMACSKGGYKLRLFSFLIFLLSI
jgi:hypothetical protein